ncbi:MAG: hypothetical protein KAI74_03220 [Kiritimatiellae bacterium]|nr:hypothetical protein [Kiritimatiellia bacterium]
MKTTKQILTVICAIMTTAQVTSALEVKLTATETAGIARNASKVTCGVPFAKGAVPDINKLSLTVNGKIYPSQFIKLAPWDDGSIRWALLDTQINVPASGKTELVVCDTAKRAVPKSAVKTTKTTDGITVSTGPMTFGVSKSKAPLFSFLKINGKDALNPTSKGLVVHTIDGKEVQAAAPDSITIEQAGPMRATICIRGKYPGIHNGLLSYTARLTAYAGSKSVKIRVWLENNGALGYNIEGKKDGKQEWFVFDGMAIDLDLALGTITGAECEGVKAKNLKVYQGSVSSKKAVSSQWAYGYSNLTYKISSGTNVLKSAQHTDGVFKVSGSDGNITAAINHFWQNYEKSIELKNSNLKLWLWPKEGLYPRLFAQHACPGYANGLIQPLRVKNGYNLSGSIHKSHEILLDFGSENPKELNAEISAPMFPLASPEYYATTEAAPGLFAPLDVKTGEEECDEKLAAWVRMINSIADKESKSSIWYARTDPDNTRARQSRMGYGYWYGWMDFGDIAVPSMGTTSLAYDWPYAMHMGAMQTGNPLFMQLASQMTKHRIEIDQGWSKREVEEFRGIQRRPGTYTHFHIRRLDYHNDTPTITENWIAGVILHYMMTGDMKSLECAKINIAAIDREWSSIATTEDYQKSSNASHIQGISRAIFAYIAMYDLTADKVWLDKANKQFETFIMPIWKRLGPHLHAANQTLSQSYTKGDIGYCYSIQTLCELHHVGGNTNVLALLKAGCDAEFPENFFDAPLFLANLNGYMAEVTSNEDYADNAIDLWIEGFPESKCPPFYMPDNSRWYLRNVMIMRTSHLIRHYYWKKQKE